MGRPRVKIEENKISVKPLSQEVRPVVVPPSTIPIREPVEIIEKNTIKLDREIYSRKNFNSTVNIGFEEFQKKEDTFSPTQFFQLYDSLFFNIPKTGNISHASLVRRSKEYIGGFNQNDPKDSIIDSLNEKIIELEQQLLLANQADPEHPFFKNGTLVGKANSSEVYYMDKGYKRQIPNTNGPFWGTLIKVLGYNTNDRPDGPGWFPTEVSNKILSQIKTGPYLTEDNFEQPTYIESGELLVGTNVTDDTKDAKINELQVEISGLKRQIEDLQDLLNENPTTGTPLGNNENVGNIGGTFNGEPTFGGQFGPNFIDPFN